MTIEEPYSGFPGIVHGGYLGGVIARAIGGTTVGVSLRRPLRIGAAVELERAGEGAAIREAGVAVAEGAPAELALAVPATASAAVSEAAAASARYPGRRHHPIPSCFCCGPGRQDDGLRIFVGPTDDRLLMAAPWTPHPRFVQPDGSMPIEVVWAALDCPAIWALVLNTERGSPDRVVTGRMVVQQRRPIAADQPHVVVAWPLAAEGRKRPCASAVLSLDGEPLALALQTCVVSAQGVPILGLLEASSGQA